MRKPLLWIVSSVITLNVWADPNLTAIETKWLSAGSPVLDYADEQNLPVDIVVQTQSKSGDAPLALGVADGRCKLVLSMRGSPDAESILKDVKPSQVNTVIEAMFAHEIGHCWRYMHGVWHKLPAGFVEIGQDISDSKELLKERQEMRETRREEGFADLVGLAWTLHKHPEQYGQVYAWLQQARADQPVKGSYHDTRAWIDLAKNDSELSHGENPFDQALALWRKGLTIDE